MKPICLFIAFACSWLPAPAAVPVLKVSDNKRFLVTRIDWVLVLDDVAKNYPSPGKPLTRK